MPYLIVTEPDGKKTTVGIFKRLTTLGKGNEVDISLTGLAIEGAVAYISQSPYGFSLVAPANTMNITVNNVPISKHELKDGDVFHSHNIRVQFFACDLPKAKDGQEGDSSAFVAYQRMLAFSKSLAKEKNIDALLERLLKEITQLTGAEHGFLVLVEDKRPIIKVREPKSREQEHSLFPPISDSVVKSVIERQEPVILSNALHDQEFSSSLSVINYRLTSVMCAPLTSQGHTFGAIYVGNNSFVNAFNKQNLELMTIYSSQAALLVQNALHINALKKQTKTLMENLELTKFGGIIGGCSGMQAVFQQAEKIASSDLSVLIVGETGTGKELIAREIHNRSPRKNGPFISFNCGAVSEEHLESELFGHVRGAFPLATQTRMGKLRAAHNGTLLLEDIGDLPLHLQVKLLRALTEQQVTKLGDNKSEEIDIRVIATTNRDLEDLVRREEFREDLFYRLNVVNIAVPSLKERGNDILVIANFFLHKYAKIYGKSIIGIEEAAQNALLNCEWPGNVRELESSIRRAIVMCDHNRITAVDLGLSEKSFAKIMPLADALERYRTRYISESLERNAGNRTKTATELGVDPRTIFRHLESKKKDAGAE